MLILVVVADFVLVTFIFINSPLELPLQPLPVSTSSSIVELRVETDFTSRRQGMKFALVSLVAVGSLVSTSAIARTSTSAPSTSLRA